MDFLIHSFHIQLCSVNHIYVLNFLFINHIHKGNLPSIFFIIIMIAFSYHPPSFLRLKIVFSSSFLALIQLFKALSLLLKFIQAIMAYQNKVIHHFHSINLFVKLT